jgi:predicted ATPase
VLLPLNNAPLIGRSRELAALAELLNQHRLVTVSGPGGVGKSSLVKAYLESLGTQTQGRWVYADLSVTADPDVVPYLIAQSLRLPISGVQTAVPALLAALGELSSVVVLDSAEHLLGSVGTLVDAILERAPGISVCVTSRVPLKRTGERVLRVEGLELPDPKSTAKDLSACGAVALFAEEARLVHQSFQLTADNQHQVAEICRQLDGMPLSIKLAAGRIPMFGISGLLQRVSERLRLLVSTGAEAGNRHQSLRATLDWSHGLLLPEQQEVFHRLGVFSAGFTLPLAVAVARDLGRRDWEVEDIVAVLVDHSLVMADGADKPRYRLLTIAQDYAREKLANNGLLEQVSLAHVRAMADLLDESFTTFWHQPENDWLAQYSTELSNMRSAISWSLAHAPDLAIPMVTAWSRLFGPFYYGLEAQRNCALVETWVTPELAPVVAARYWIERATRLIRQDDRQALQFAENGIALSRRVDDKSCLYQALGWAAVSLTQPQDRAHTQLAEMATLEQAGWTPKMRHLRPFALSLVLERDGRLRDALAANKESFELARQAQSPSRLLFCLYHQASLLLSLGEFQAAVEAARPGVEQLKGHFSILGLVLKVIHAGALVMTHQLDDARSRFLDVVQSFRIFEWRWFGLSSVCLALLAARQGRFRSATLILGYASHMSVKVGGRDAAGQQIFAISLNLVEQQLEPEEFARLWAEGSRLSEEQVCSLALNDTDDISVTSRQVPVVTPEWRRS